MPGLRFAIMMLLLLQGCGVKGPLYLPTEKQRHDTAERERLLQEREARRKGQAPAAPAEQQPAPAEEHDTDLLPEVAPPPSGEIPEMEPAAPPPP